MASDVMRDIKGGLVASTAGIAFSIANGALIYTGTLQPMLAACSRRRSSALSSR